MSQLQSPHHTGRRAGNTLCRKSKTTIDCFLVVLLLLLTNTLSAQNASQNLGASASGDVDALQAITVFQQKADNYFNHRDYERAYKSYRRLAGHGDKFAQFRLAVMHDDGLGVAVNIPQAYAWAAVAAEGNRTEFVAYRDELYAQLDDSQWAQAETLANQRVAEVGNFQIALNTKRRMRREKIKCAGKGLMLFGRGCGVVVCNGFRNAIPSHRCLAVGALGLPGLDNIPDVGKFLAAIDSQIEQYNPGYVEFGELELLEDELDTEPDDPEAVTDDQ